MAYLNKSPKDKNVHRSFTMCYLHLVFILSVITSDKRFFDEISLIIPSDTRIINLYREIECILKLFALPTIMMYSKWNRKSFGCM